jgi:uncharacterized phiE125 gp8 family phage protein
MSQSLTLIAPATEEPISIDEFKAHLHGVAESDDDNDLARKLLSAREYIEGELHRALITSTWKLSSDRWPCKPYLEFPLGNLQSVGTIKYAQPDGCLLTWDADNYKLAHVYDPMSGVNDARVGRLYHGYNIPWPPGPLDVGEPIEIPFTCGWKDAASVPASIKAAIELVAGLLYRNREAVITAAREVSVVLNMNGATGAVEALLSKYVLYD